MSLDSIIMMLGAFAIVVPQLGMTASLQNIVVSVIGVFVVACGIIVRRRVVVSPSRHKHDAQVLQSIISETNSTSHANE